MIAGGDTDTQAYLEGSYQQMLTELLYYDEFLDTYTSSFTKGRFEARGEIHVDMAKSEEDDPEEGLLLGVWKAVVEIRSGEKVITSLTIRGPDGDELQ